MLSQLPFDKNNLQNIMNEFNNNKNIENRNKIYNDMIAAAEKGEGYLVIKYVINDMLKQELIEAKYEVVIGKINYGDRAFDYNITVVDWDDNYNWIQDENGYLQRVAGGDSAPDNSENSGEVTSNENENKE